MLYGRRKRLDDLAAREAAGETFWTASFDPVARRRIVLLAKQIAESVYNGAPYLVRARALILHDEGMFFLCNSGDYPENDMLNYIVSAPDSMMPSVIEALSSAFNDNKLAYDTGGRGSGATFDLGVATILREHRISYDLVGGRMVEFSSRALHVNVVAPTLTLLAGDPRWAATEKAFQDALTELSGGKPEDAITDAGTALQEALVASGCVGNALGPLIKSAKAKGLFAPHDHPMVDALEKLMNWVSADRSQRGDAHSSAAASVDDAWLTVHIVGAVVLRLSKPAARS